MLRNRKKWMSFVCVLAAGVCGTLQGESSNQGSLEWGVSKSTYNLSSSLKDRWVFSLLQECVRSKVEKTFVACDLTPDAQVELGFLPCQFSISFNEEESEKLSELNALLEEKNPVFLEEFEEIQNLWKAWVEKEKNFSADSDWIEEVVLEFSASYAEFLMQSEKVLQDISLDDLMAAFHQEMKKEVGRITLNYEKKSPSFFRKELGVRSSSLLSMSPKKGWEPAAGESRGGTPKSEEAKAFFDLTITDEDKITTRKLITNLADKNVLQLLMDRKSMEGKGDKVRPVHPLRFIGFILADPNLNRCMKSISKTTFKWNSFVEGFEKRMKEESKAGNLNRHVPGFADYMEVDRNTVQNYINQGNYEKLIKYFL